MGRLSIVITELVQTSASYTQQPLGSRGEVVPGMSVGRLNAAPRGYPRGYPIQGQRCIPRLEMLTEASVREETE